MARIIPTKISPNFVNRNQIFNHLEPYFGSTLKTQYRNLAIFLNSDWGPPKSHNFQTYNFFFFFLRTFSNRKKTTYRLHQSLALISYLDGTLGRNIYFWPHKDGFPKKWMLDLSIVSTRLLHCIHKLEADLVYLFHTVEMLK
jgi:hypothetical protein